MRGRSGNPGGRPKVVAEIRELAQRHGQEAIERLVVLMRSKSGRVAALAARELLDRGYGKAPLAVGVAALRDPSLIAARLGEGALSQADAAAMYELVMRGDLDAGALTKATFLPPPERAAPPPQESAPTSPPPAAAAPVETRSRRRRDEPAVELTESSPGEWSAPHETPGYPLSIPRSLVIHEADPAALRRRLMGGGG